jgi:hypothetical protein
MALASASLVSVASLGFILISMVWPRMCMVRMMSVLFNSFALIPNSAAAAATSAEIKTT